MVIAITKRKKSRETKREKCEKTLSRSQLTKFTLNINLQTLAQGTVGLQILVKTKRRPESGVFRVKEG